MPLVNRLDVAVAAPQGDTLQHVRQPWGVEGGGGVRSPALLRSPHRRVTQRGGRWEKTAANSRSGGQKNPLKNNNNPFNQRVMLGLPLRCDRQSCRVIRLRGTSSAENSNSTRPFLTFERSRLRTRTLAWCRQPRSAKKTPFLCHEWRQKHIKVHSHAAITARLTRSEWAQINPRAAARGCSSPHRRCC